MMVVCSGQSIHGLAACLAKYA